jgi:hypothetical protein
MFCFFGTHTVLHRLDTDALHLLLWQEAIRFNAKGITDKAVVTIISRLKIYTLFMHEYTYTHTYTAYIAYMAYIHTYTHIRYNAKGITDKAVVTIISRLKIHTLFMYA